jgi:uncharacterized protein with ParB-like and HNH nuclease domain
VEPLEISGFQPSSLEQIFNRKDAYYSVSYFQRDYSWTKDQVTTLYEDIATSLKEGRSHFMGFMTFFKPDEGPEIQIIEGQQRLATITTFAAVIRDVLLSKKEEKWKTIDSDLIRTTDIYDSSSRDKLQLSDLNKKFFHEYIQTEGIPDDKIKRMAQEKLLRSSNRLIKESYEYFYEKLKAEVSLLDLLRQATRSFVVITTEVKNLASAYMIFQTLNGRGLDLTLSDLLKTHLLRLYEKQWADAKREWDIISNLPGITDMNNFLRHYWLSTRGIVREDQLFIKFSSEIATKDAADKFLTDLRKEAEWYSILSDPHQEDINSKIITELLRDKLYPLSKQQVLPLLLASFRTWKNAEIQRMLPLLTTFIFRYLTIGAKENNKLERLFSDVSMGIRDRSISTPEQLADRFRKENPGDDEFRVLFASKQIRENAKASYIMRAIEEYISKAQEKFYADVTLEHILPVNPDDECKAAMVKNGTWDDKDELTYRLGNLTLLLGKHNRKARNRIPSWKSREIYAKETKLEINKDLTNISDWSSAEIDKRQAMLATYAVKIWAL